MCSPVLCVSLLASLFLPKRAIPLSKLIYTTNSLDINSVEEGQGAVKRPNTGFADCNGLSDVCCCVLQVVCGTMGLPTCTVQLKGPDSITRVAVGVGTGEVGV